MNSGPHSLENLQDRLLQLEKQNRRFKQLGTIALVIAAVIVEMGQAPAKKIVEANEFVLRDDGGNMRARLFMTPAGPPMLALYDKKEALKAMLDTNALTLLENLSDNKTAAAVLSHDSLELADAAGFEAILGTLPTEGTRTAASLVLFDKDKNVIWKAP
jgi:hypothetical protein